MKCEKCTAHLNGQEEFCPNCGAKIVRRRNKKIILVSVVALVILTSCGFLYFWINHKKDNSNYSAFSNSNSISYNYDESGKLKFIDGAFSDVSVTRSEDVIFALEELKDQLGFTNVSEELKLDSIVESEGITYYKYNQVYKDIPVLYQNLIVSVDKKGHILSYSGYYISDIKISTSPKRSEDDIKTKMKEYLGTNSNIGKIELGIWASHKNQSLVYEVSGYSDTKALLLLVDANTGDILSEASIFDYAKPYEYTGFGLNGKQHTINMEEYFDIDTLKTKYRFYDPERNISIADYRNVGPVIANFASLIPGTIPYSVSLNNGVLEGTWIDDAFVHNAVTAMANYEKIYDYYKNILGRNSYDNKGSKIVINLGVTAETFSKESLNNAFWSRLTDQMYIGSLDGQPLSSCLDVLGHEFTHGVILHTAKFASSPKKEDINKAFETGALSEAYADILGSLIEGKNWEIAEDIKIGRSLSDPIKYQSAAVKGGEYYIPDGYLTDEVTVDDLLKANNVKSVADLDQGGVHYNATVVGHAAYLMYEAGAFASREEMARVWYNSLLLLSSYSNFEDCALAVMKTARNMGLSASSVSKIMEAFQKTKILEDNHQLVQGTIHSGDEKLDNVSIKVYSTEDGKEMTSTASDETGNYELSLQPGVYKIEFVKDGFEKYVKVMDIKGKTTLDVELASIEKRKENNDIQNACTTDDCYNLTIYFLSDGVNKSYQTYAYKAGTVITSDLIVDLVNKASGRELITSDGASFYINMGPIPVDVTWYYKGTDKKFNWNQPINEDIVIEMKILNGMISDDTLSNYEFGSTLKDSIDKYDADAK